MSKYKLKEDFAGKEAGTILETEESSTILAFWSYKGANVTLTTSSELVELIREPLAYTDADQIYLGVSKDPLYEGDRFYYINTNNGIQGVITTPNSIFSTSGLKRFKTFGVANYYREAQQAIKGSLGIGDYIPLGRYERVTPQLSNEYTIADVDPVHHREIIKVVTYNHKFHYVVQGGDWPILYPIDQFISKPLMFGGKQVTITKTGPHILINHMDYSTTYGKLKQFIEAVDFVKNFKISNGRASVTTDAAVSLNNRMSIGCTTGTFDELRAILTACEKL